MKRALTYSLILHFLIFLLINLLQFYWKQTSLEREPISVVLIPPQQIPQQKIHEKERKTPPIEKIPTIEKSDRPKFLSSIPKKGIENQESKLETKEEEKSIGKLDRIKKFEGSEKKPDIFDRDVIAKLSKNHAQNKSSEGSQGLSFSAKEFNDWGYLQRLKEKIERVWQYPPEAAERGIYGDLYIKFIIDKKGKLVSIELLRTSGYRMLDDAAIKALKDAQPFWPLPEDWQKDYLTITGHFIYTLRGFYLR